MKFLEAYENLKEGQMITSATAPSANTPLEVRWDWGYAKPNFARGYIPLNHHVQVLVIPKPKVGLKDALAKLMPSISEKQIEEIKQGLLKEQIDWESEAQQLI